MKKIYFILSAALISLSSIAVQASTCTDPCTSWSNSLEASCETKGLDDNLPGGLSGI